MSAGQGSRLGVVTGYRGEAVCLPGPDLDVVCSGADSNRARTAARRLVDKGACGLISFGLAGGLAPHLQPGDLLLPEAVISPDLRRLETDPAWRGRLQARLREGRLAAIEAPTAGSDRIVATPEAKRLLFEGTGAIAVDMESHALAEVAAEAGLPFLAVRAVADRANQRVPQAAREAIDADGQVQHLTVLGGLMRRPWEIGTLISLGRSSGRGLETLRRVALLAPALGFT